MLLAESVKLVESWVFRVESESSRSALIALAVSLKADSCSVRSCEVESANSEACAVESVFILESNWLLATCCWLLRIVVVSFNAVLISWAVSTKPFPEAAETLFIKPLKVDAVSAS